MKLRSFFSLYSFEPTLGTFLVASRAAVSKGFVEAIVATSCIRRTRSDSSNFFDSPRSRSKWRLNRPDDRGALHLTASPVRASGGIASSANRRGVTSATAVERLTSIGTQRYSSRSSVTTRYVPGGSCRNA